MRHPRVNYMENIFIRTFFQLKPRGRFVSELIGILVFIEDERGKREVGRRDRWCWNADHRVLVKWAEDISTTHLNILLWSVFIIARSPFESFDLLSNLFGETSRPAFIAFRQQYNPHRVVESTTLPDVFLFYSQRFIISLLFSYQV